MAKAAEQQRRRELESGFNNLENARTVKHYQDARLRENTAPKSINKEVGFLLRLMDIPAMYCAFGCGRRTC